VWLEETNEVVVSRSVAVDENVYWTDPKEYDSDDEVQMQPTPPLQAAQQQQHTPEGRAEESEGEGSEESTADAPEPAAKMPRRSERLAARGGVARVLALQAAPEPESYIEAMESGEQDQWRAAMDQEIASLKENQVYTVEPIPSNARVLPTKWVYRRKPAGDGVVHKARFVAKGFAQQEGIDYSEVFAPVSAHPTLRMLLAHVAKEDLELHQLDIATAFLHGELEERVYVRPPEGYECGEGKCWQLHKALYGLKQAPRAWYGKLRRALEEFGFVAATADPALFVRSHDKETEFLLVYVDDLLIAARELIVVEHTKKEVLSRFKGRDLGEAGVYLGLHITRDRAAGTLKVSQQAYSSQLLKKHGLEEAKSRSTPMDQGTKLSKEGDSVQDEGERKRYASTVGALLYLANCTRPDIAYATSSLARFMSAPTQQHLQAAKAVLRYLAGTLDQGVVYSKHHGDGLVGYGDADYAGCVDTRRSTSGYVFLCAGGAVSWQSKRQTVVALSTAEAEYIAAAALVREALWLQRLERDMCMNETDVPVPLRTDNQAALHIINGSMGSRRVKHVEVPFHFARDMTEKGKVQFAYCSTNEMAADALTKPLGPSALGKCKKLMGLQ
jgi:hypothetical protein